MFYHSWKKELLTIPNLLSLFRLVLIPVYIQMYREASNSLDYYLTGTVLGISCLTDMADGKIAREYHMVSRAGKVLDPLADKMTQLALLLSLSNNHRILYPILILFLTKETFQLSCMILFARKGKALSGALLSGKLCTTILFGSFLLLVCFPELTGFPVTLMMLLDATFLLYAFGDYYLAYFGKQSKLTDLNND